MNAPQEQTSKPLAIWLFICAAMVFAMMVIGAITRLSESGLSMVEWRPLIGTLPPMNEAEWNRVFDLYQHSPEFQKKHFWMELGDFKKIFFWEWLHRLWGRSIGLVFALPLAFFWIRGSIPKGYHVKLLGMLVLGGAQGFMGWYMVKSGLVDIPAVSHFRLAAHLSLAFLISALLLWLGLSVWGAQKRPSKALFLHGLGVLTLVSITIVWGAFTAGLDAGLLYNDSFPKMGGLWIPPEVTSAGSLLKDPASVQFAHRWLALISAAALLSLWAHAVIFKKRGFWALHALALMALLQPTLGVLTLFSGVHLHIAAAHQAGAILTFALLIISLHAFYPKVSRNSGHQS
ncbi:MAG: COX15/CtaA family protein [Alphaproteobacteria bacterium]|nr:COX15/CtaA family protein [Alphaproteobacteria bacterium]